MTTQPARQAGFTLLEITVALVVFGLLLIGLTQGVQFGVRAWHSEAVMLDEHGKMEAVDTTLRNLIEPLDPGGGPGFATITGLPHAMAFTTTLPEAAADAGDRHANVSLGVDGHHDLILRYTPYLHAIQLGGAGTSVIQADVLLAKVAQIDFSYWQADGRWSTQWDHKFPPPLLRIRIVFMDQRHWPEIVIAPRRQPAD